MPRNSEASAAMTDRTAEIKKAIRKPISNDPEIRFGKKALPRIFVLAAAERL